MQANAPCMGAGARSHPRAEAGPDVMKESPRKLLLRERPWEDSGGRVGTGRHSPQQAGQCGISAQPRETTTSNEQEPLPQAREDAGAPESHSETASIRGRGGNQDPGQAALPPTPT